MWFRFSVRRNAVLALVVAALIFGSSAALAVAWDREWVTTYSEYAGSASDVAIDADGNVVAGGRVYSRDLGSYAYLLVKLNAEGEILWSVINDVSDSNDCIEAIAVDPEGYIYATGYADWSGGEEFVTVKYSPDGDFEWIAKEEDPSGLNIRGVDIAVDPFGNPTTVGHRQAADGYYDLYIAHYDADGNLQWDDSYDGGGTLWETFSGVAVHSSGTIYATGTARYDGIARAAVTVKYTPEGSRAWMDGRTGSGKYMARGMQIVVTDDESIFVAGYGIGSDGNGDVLLVRYRPDGTAAWTRLYDGYTQDYPYGLAVDDAGKIYVAGESFNWDPGSDALTVSFYDSGTPRWNDLWTSGLNDNNVFQDVAVRPDGLYIFSTGYHWGTYGEELPRDMTTVAYDRYGNRVWEDVFGSTEKHGAESQAVAATADGRTVVAGFVPDEAAGWSWALTVVQYRTCAGCLIDGTCYDSGAYDPENSCRGCNPQLDAYDWTQFDGLDCSDAFFCYAEATCQAGVCTPSVLNTCDDGVSCTVDSCDEDADRCVNVPDDSACDDGAWCNGAETCDADAGCIGGEAPDCDDGVGCTIDACDEEVDKCFNAPDDFACDDGAWCNGAETCDANVGCVDGTAPDCADAIDCTFDFCDEDEDACVNAPDDAACDDGAWCNGAETCDGNAGCLDGEAPDCADGVACTVDSCDEEADACVNAPDDSACDDGNVCTDDVCDPSQNGCVTTFNSDPCDDGLFCTGDDFCAGGTCSNHAGDPCGDDQTCEEDADVCVDDPGLCGFAGTGGAGSLAVLVAIAVGLARIRRRRSKTYGIG